MAKQGDYGKATLEFFTEFVKGDAKVNGENPGAVLELALTCDDPPLIDHSFFWFVYDSEDREIGIRRQVKGAQRDVNNYRDNEKERYSYVILAVTDSTTFELDTELGVQVIGVEDAKTRKALVATFTKDPRLMLVPNSYFKELPTNNIEEHIQATLGLLPMLPDDDAPAKPKRKAPAKKAAAKTSAKKPARKRKRVAVPKQTTSEEAAKATAPRKRKSPAKKRPVSS